MWLNRVPNAAKNTTAGGFLCGFLSIPVVTSSDPGELQCCFSSNFSGFSIGRGGGHISCPNHTWEVMAVLLFGWFCLHDCMCSVAFYSWQKKSVNNFYQKICKHSTLYVQLIFFIHIARGKIVRFSLLRYRWELVNKFNFDTVLPESKMTGFCNLLLSIDTTHTTPLWSFYGTFEQCSVYGRSIILMKSFSRHGTLFNRVRAVLRRIKEMWNHFFLAHLPQDWKTTIAFVSWT